MNTIQNKMTTEPVENTQLSNNTQQSFKSINTSNILEVASNMINSGEVKTTIDFVNKFMFALDSEEPFPINIDMLVEEKIYDKRGNVKRALEKYFTEGTDYQVQKLASLQREAVLKKQNGGQNKQNITLTVDCFKAMCMIAQSAFGKQTQMYYLDLEKIFKKYITVEYEKVIKNIHKKDGKISLNIYFYRFFL